MAWTCSLSIISLVPNVLFQCENAIALLTFGTSMRVAD
jgi:hypothetical protein